MKLHTEREAATLLGRSIFTVQRLRKAGKLPWLPGRPILIDDADLQAYIVAKNTPHPVPYSGWPKRNQRTDLSPREIEEDARCGSNGSDHASRAQNAAHRALCVDSR